MPIIRHGYAPPRGTTTQRGYGTHHKHTRNALAHHVNQGHATCPRCHQPILPGQAWDLDHTTDRTGYLGASHTVCNRGNRTPPAPPKNRS